MLTKIDLLSPGAGDARLYGGGRSRVLSTFAGLLLSGLLLTASCHKAAPVAARPPEPVPVGGYSKNPWPRHRQPRQRRQPAGRSELAPNGITPEDRTVLNDRLAHLEDALFDYDKSTIRTDAATALKDDVGAIRGILAKDPNEKLRIEGHCDERGSDEYNLALGDKRAQAASEFLQTMGIPSAQVTVISYGKEKPVCTEQTEACWQKNRRAHIVAQN